MTQIFLEAATTGFGVFDKLIKKKVWKHPSIWK